ncbi:transmembrane protein [Mycobacterium phage RitVan]|nr:transmembrane protein [Mycobacterium phage RitVan]
MDGRRPADTGTPALTPEGIVRMSHDNLRPIWTPDDYWKAVREAADHAEHRGAINEDPHYARSATPPAEPRRGASARTVIRALLAMASGAVLVAMFVLWLAPAVKADTPDCLTQFWLIPFQSNTRTICDGPIQPDGSWQRAREFWSPAYTAPARSSCSGGYRYSSCTYYPERFVPRKSAGVEVYPVRPETVLPDEPGHIG